MTSLRKPGSSDLEVFPPFFGGNVFGWTADETASFAVLDAYAAAGGDFVDTADSYSAWTDGNSGGQSETIIGWGSPARAKPGVEEDEGPRQPRRHRDRHQGQPAPRVPRPVRREHLAAADAHHELKLSQAVTGSTPTTGYDW
jgi:hypothetical protein